MCIEDGKILSLFEEYVGEKLVKLPGGGLEYGEGLLECLHREFQEELNVKIEILEHFYTQEDFLVSKFRENEQLLTVYYRVKILDPENFKLNVSEIEKAEWLPLSASNPFKLPTDKIVFEKAKAQFLK